MSVLLLEFVFVLLFSGVSAGATFLYDFCLGEPDGKQVQGGRIFSRLGQYLVKLFD